MSKHGTDERGWPTVPIDPAAIPKGYEAVRVGWPTKGESSVSVGGEVFTWEYSFLAPESPRLIVRPVRPIELPLSIVPHGWWIAKDRSGEVWIYRHEPKLRENLWSPTTARVHKLPPRIADQLPREWHELPWDKSAMQQTLGGDA